MKDKVFIDTNILIYFYSKTEPEKRNIIKKILENKNLVISTQVLNEFTNVLLRKFSVTQKEIKVLLEELDKWCLIQIVDLNTIRLGLDISEKFKYSYFDSLIISSAIESNTNVLYSEDMHHGHLINNKLSILNPFKEDFHEVLEKNIEKYSQDLKELAKK